MKTRKKVIVTGGAGYIGSHTAVELYHAGYLPILIDNYANSQASVPLRVNELCGAPIPFYELDCGNRQGLQKLFKDLGEVFAVIHFAAHKAVGESVNAPAKYYENNIGSLANLLQVMAKNSRAGSLPGLVFSSSCTVYGEPEHLPVTESTPIKPATSPYGFTKQVCEQLIRDVVASGQNLPSVTLRYFNPIGAHPSGLIGELPLGTPNNLVPFITQTAAGLRPELTIFGDDYPTPDGTNIRDYIHVVDLARAHVKALQFIASAEASRFNQIVNIGSGSGNSVLEVVQAFEKVTNTKLNYKIGPKRAGDVIEVWAASNQNILGWEAEFSLEDALRDAWNWQQKLALNA
ncbi:MAG TPA: UDP-glucose 4-epimerase GalE [Bacteroidetes bacterium]|nr:UDP-glucose 4-epimerase GalE [Bacteroidota bacterium]